MEITRAATLENDIISGMLTAIKSFVAGALKSSDQGLEDIVYETFKLILNDFQRFMR